MYQDDEVFAKIKWSIADLRSALEHRGYEPSDANIEAVLSTRFKRTLEEQSIEHGWETMNTMLYFDIDGLTVLEG